jgi:hypothetical protein
VAVQQHFARAVARHGLKTHALQRNNLQICKIFIEAAIDSPAWL